MLELHFEIDSLVLKTNKVIIVAESVEQGVQVLRAADEDADLIMAEYMIPIEKVVEHGQMYKLTENNRAKPGWILDARQEHCNVLREINMDSLARELTEDEQQIIDDQAIYLTGE